MVERQKAIRLPDVEIQAFAEGAAQPLVHKILCADAFVVIHDVFGVGGAAGDHLGDFDHIGRFVRLGCVPCAITTDD